MATGFNRPFRAAPLRAIAGGRLGAQGGATHRRRQSASNWSFPALMVALPLAAFSAALLWDGPGTAAASSASSTRDTEQARFAQCEGGHRVTCVVDGDTIWYQGTKIRIADINTPEVSEPRCAYEAQLGARATERLTGLLNAGPFSFAPIDRAYDKYGRRLLVVTRDGRSLGDTLVAEGLAERWRGYRRDWCT
jgi:endonuclease YncB( thermonuclease family)